MKKNRLNEKMVMNNDKKKLKIILEYILIKI